MALDRSDSRCVGRQPGSAEALSRRHLGTERRSRVDRARWQNVARRRLCLSAAEFAHMNLVTHDFVDAGALAPALARAVASDLVRAIAARGTALLAVSGGRTPLKFF